MKWFRLIGPALLASQLVLTAASDPAAVNFAGGSGPGEGQFTAIPPVLRTVEPAESRLLVLPGPPKSAIPQALQFKTAPPVAKMARLSTKLVLDPILRQPLPRIEPTTGPPVRGVSAVGVPSGLEREIALYCQKQIGHWREADASGVLGHPTRQRPAYDEKTAVNGTIYAFADPTGRYEDLELDFDRESGRLRTVFVYPAGLTWQDCRRLWAGTFTSADAKQGRVFYSYTSRRLDVLVDAAGKVVSLGWY